MFVRFKAGLAAAAVVAAPLAVATTIAPSADGAGPVKDYANCTQLHRDYKYGVARTKAAANKQVRDGYHRPAVKPRVYKLNNESDADNDGTACEA